MTSASNFQPGFGRLLRIAEQRALAGMEAATDQGGPCLQVDGSTFVGMLDARTAVLHCPVDQKVLLMEISPDLYFETEEYVGRDAMLIRLERIDDEELSLRLHDAWMFMAPERRKKG